MQTSEWWLSTEKMTFGIKVTNGNIVRAAPIARKFVGQPFNNLIRWLKKQNGFKMKKLPTRNDCGS